MREVPQVLQGPKCDNTVFCHSCPTPASNLGGRSAKEASLPELDAEGPGPSFWPSCHSFSLVTSSGPRGFTTSVLKPFKLVSLTATPLNSRLSYQYPFHIPLRKLSSKCPEQNPLFLPPGLLPYLKKGNSILSLVLSSLSPSCPISQGIPSERSG